MSKCQIQVGTLLESSGLTSSIALPCQLSGGLKDFTRLFFLFSLMAEVLGIVTSSLQLVDTALKAREYIKDFNDAPEEQRKLFEEIGYLKALLTELQKRITGTPSTNTLTQMAGPLSKLHTVLKDITAKVKPAKGVWSKFVKQLTWSLWNKKEAQEYLDELERFKSLISVWLGIGISCVPVGHYTKSMADLS
jgi:hypothetical protein